LIERHKITGKPVASTERPKGLAELMRQRDEIEQREEQIVLSAERGDGLELDSRPDASPALVVCTVLDDAAAA